MGSGAALRRAVAKFHGLLRAGGNRKKPYRKSLFRREALGPSGPCRRNSFDHAPPDCAPRRGRRYRLRRSGHGAGRVSRAAAGSDGAAERSGFSTGAGPEHAAQRSGISAGVRSIRAAQRPRISCRQRLGAGGGDWRGADFVPGQWRGTAHRRRIRAAGRRRQRRRVAGRTSA